jgi:para-nitrobenzyl esterase
VEAIAHEREVTCMLAVLERELSSRGLFIWAVAALAVVAHSTRASAEPGVVVETRSGPVRGLDTGDMLQWRGIPFARPPVGELRFRRPVPPSSWTATRDASRFAPPCSQGSYDWMEGRFVSWGSEDCLYLNVFAPPGSAPGSSKSVVVHAFGGGNSFGGAIEDPIAFVENDVIVVSFHYRLGFLGFGAHPALTEEGGGTSSNYAIWDYLAVLSWVQDNIAAFGGDPDNVTIMGFSSGGIDTRAVAVSPQARGRFHRVASHAVFRHDIRPDTYYGPYSWGAVLLEDLETTGLAVAADVGCAAAVDVLACLRAVPVETFLQLFDGHQWFPAIDGTLLRRTIHEQMKENGGLGVPLLVGGTRDEGGWSALWMPELGWRNYVQATADLVGAPDAKKARDAYPLSDHDSYNWAFIQLETDLDKSCPTRRFALAANAPTYRFLYTHTLENTGDGWGEIVRSAHGLEDGMLWRQIWDFSSDAPYQMTPVERLLHERMARYWTNFAKHGDPNEHGLPAWPLYEPERLTYLDLGAEIRAVEGDFQAAQCERIQDMSYYGPFSCGAICRTWEHSPPGMRSSYY